MVSYNCTQKGSLFDGNNKSYRNLKDSDLPIYQKIAYIYFLGHGQCTNEGSRSVEIEENMILFKKGNQEVRITQSLFDRLTSIYPFYTMKQLSFISQFYINHGGNGNGNGNVNKNINSLFVRIGLNRTNRNALISRSSKDIGASLFGIFNFANTSGRNARRVDVFRYIYEKVMSQLHNSANADENVRWKAIILALLYAVPNDDMRIPGIYVRFVPGAMATGGFLPNVSVVKYYPKLDEFFGNDYDSFSLIQKKEGLISQIREVQDIDHILSVHAKHSLGLYSPEMLDYIQHTFGISNMTANVYFSIAKAKSGNMNGQKTINIRKNSNKNVMNRVDPTLHNLFTFFLGHTKSQITSTIFRAVGMENPRKISLVYGTDDDMEPTYVSFYQDRTHSISLPYKTVLQIASYGIVHLSYSQLEMIYRILYRSEDAMPYVLFLDENLVKYTLLYTLIFVQNSTFRDVLSKLKRCTSQFPENIQIPNMNKGVQQYMMGAARIVAQVAIDYVGIPGVRLNRGSTEKTQDEKIFSQILTFAQFMSLECSKEIDLLCIFKAYETICSSSSSPSCTSSEIQKSYVILVDFSKIFVQLINAYDAQNHILIPNQNRNRNENRNKNKNKNQHICEKSERIRRICKKGERTNLGSLAEN